MSNKQPDSSRKLLEFTFLNLQSIVMRKHSSPPLVVGDLRDVPTKELSEFIDVLRELAHLPHD